MAVDLFKFFTDCDFGGVWVEAECLLKTMLCHCEVGDGGPLLFVKEDVVCDGEEGHFIDRMEGCPGVVVHLTAHQFLKGFVAGGEGDVCWADGLGDKHVCRGIVVATVD